MPALGGFQQFARIGFWAIKRSFAREPLANEVLHVTVGHFSLAAVCMLGDVVSGNDAELAKLDDRAHFGFAKLVAAAPAIEHAESVPDIHLRPSVPRTHFRSAVAH